MDDDDLNDVKAGLASLAKAQRSIITARQAVETMHDSREKREAGIALAHAEVTADLAERLFKSLLPKRAPVAKSNGAAAELEAEEADE